MDEIHREIKQRERAVARGALVRPPRDERELRLEENANEAEIDMLTSRRSRLWRKLSDSLIPDWERRDLEYSLDGATRSLEIAFAVKRRLMCARRLFKEGIFS